MKKNFAGPVKQQEDDESLFGYTTSQVFSAGRGWEDCQAWVLGYFLSSNLQPPGSWDIFLLVICNLRGPGIFSY
jgi:hypothetical protein